MPVWTDEQVAKLTELVSSRQNLTADMIATQIGGVSRNAVIGKIHRLGLAWDRKNQFESKEGAAKNRVINAALRRAPSFKPKIKRIPTFPAYAVADPIIEDIAPDKRIKFADLTPTSCRWPVGTPGDSEFGFCPHEHVEGLPYCAGHAKVAYRPAEVRVREPAKVLVEA